MPNHVKNVLKFKRTTAEDQEFLEHMICSLCGDESAGEALYHIDFDKIIPEPREELECPDDFKVNKDSHVAEVTEKPWFDWFKWRNEYWGTKWNAYDSYVMMNKNSITFVFHTAWSMPYPIIKRLTVLGYPFEHRWADEDYGSNCGKITWASEQGWQEAWESEAYKDPVKFAQRLWRDY